MHTSAVVNSTPVTSAPTAAKVAGTPSPTKEQPAKTAPAQPQPSTTVTISSAAVAALAAQKEALETPQQTATEARGNDHQAQRLVAKEALKAQRA